MIKRMLIMLVLFGVVLGGLFGFKGFVNGKIKEAMAGMANTPQTVSAAKAESSDWQPTIDAVGSLRAVRGADLSLEVPGVVEEISFNSGDEVQAGQILLRLRAEDEIAKLQSLEATAQLAQITYDRDVQLFKARAISQAVVDNDEANLRNFKAQVAQQKAIVDKKTLRAPFAGRLGLRQVDLGQFLSAGTVIATLQSLDPIFVDFLLPQQTVAQLAVGAKVEAKVDAFPGRVFTGKITAINPKIETASRNIQVRAMLPNADQKLLPGMFATVQLETGAAQRLITLPQTAVSYNPYGSLVYLVDDKGQGADKGPDGKPQLTARQVFVTTGATRGDQVAILKGVAEGDMVVTSGQIKLRNGVPVVVDNSVVPTNDPAPKIVDH
jgi:membrane fusion protein (multidrug efflux system)